MSIAKELGISTHLYRALRDIGARLQNGDKEGAIALYYELLNSGHSVDEILNTVGPDQRKSDQGNAAREESPQSESNEVVTDFNSEVALVEAEQVNLLHSFSLNVPHDAESCKVEKRKAAQSAPLNELRSDDREQIHHKNLPGSEPDIFRPAKTHASTGHGILINSGDQVQVRPGKLFNISTGIEIGRFFMIASARIEVLSFFSSV